jgi:hypothetical protein
MALLQRGGILRPPDFSKLGSDRKLESGGCFPEFAALSFSFVGLPSYTRCLKLKGDGVGLEAVVNLAPLGD